MLFELALVIGVLKMKLKHLFTLSLACLVLSACASKYELNKQQRAEAYAKFIETESLTQVDSIRSFRLNGWAALGDQHMILNATPSRPYLITFRNKCSNLDFVHGIQVHKRGAMLESKFDFITTMDTVKVNCYIDTIHQLTKEQKKSLLAIGKVNEKQSEES